MPNIPKTTNTIRLSTHRSINLKLYDTTDTNGLLQGLLARKCVPRLMNMQEAAHTVPVRDETGAWGGGVV